MEKVSGRIVFVDAYNKCYDRDFVATLGKSGAFDYGNGTSVLIEFSEMANGKKCEPVYIDTRYVTGIEKDFEQWLVKWFNANYQDHNIIVDCE